MRDKKKTHIQSDREREREGGEKLTNSCCLSSKLLSFESTNIVYTIRLSESVFAFLVCVCVCFYLLSFWHSHGARRERERETCQVNEFAEFAFLAMPYHTVSYPILYHTYNIAEGKWYNINACHCLTLFAYTASILLLFLLLLFWMASLRIASAECRSQHFPLFHFAMYVVTLFTLGS